MNAILTSIFPCLLFFLCNRKIVLNSFENALGVFQKCNQIQTEFNLKNTLKTQNNFFHRRKKFLISVRGTI